MQSEIEKFLKPCKKCQRQLTKHAQGAAHQMYRAAPSTMPRTSITFDFKGMSPSSAKHAELAYARLTSRRMRSGCGHKLTDGQKQRPKACWII